MDIENQIKLAAMTVKRLKPPVPKEFATIQEHMLLDNANQDYFCKLVAQSPDRAAQLLQLAKKTYMSDSRETPTNLRQIAHMYGLYPLYTLYLALVIEDIECGRQEVNIMNYNRNVALAAAQIAHWIYEISPSEAYLIGLLHNIGSVMGVRLDDHYQDIFAQQVFYPYAGLQYEVHRLQTQHSLMGALLIKNWGLRNEISKAVILHHDRDYLSKTEKHPNVRQITAMLKLANYVALLSHNAESITPELLDYRDNAKRGLENLPLEQVMNAAQAAIETFGCKLDFLEPYEENLIDACGPWR